MPQPDVFASSSSSQPHHNRLFGQFIVNYKLQFKFSLILFAIMSVAVLAMYFQTNLMVKNLLNSGAIYNEDVIEQLKILTSLILKTGIIVMAITFGITLLLTHYIAGPIYRFEKTFQGIRDGDLSMYVRLRKGDELQGVADSLNQAIVSLRNKLKKDREIIQSNVQQLENLAAALRQSGKSEEASQVLQVVSELKASGSQIKLG